MAEGAVDEREPGAPFPKGQPDPELIKLKRSRPKIGLVTAAGLLFLCGLFLVRLNPDRKFGGSGEAERVAITDVLAGNVALDRFIRIDGAEPLMSHAIRTTTAKGSLGLRVVPVRGSGNRLWIAMSGDGWDAPAQGVYVGRLRKLADMPFSKSLVDYVAEHPRPVFATAASVRAAFSTGKLQSVSGDAITLADSDRIAFDVVDTNATVIVGTINERFPTPQAWQTALAGAGIATSGTPRATADTVRFDVATDPALSTKLEAASLWAARIEPVTHHYETTWSELRGSSPAGFVVKGTTIPDAQADLIGLYVERSIPSDAYAVITGERPDDYWYVLPISIALIGVGLVFAWALVRAIKRDLMTPQVPTAQA